MSRHDLAGTPPVFTQPHHPNELLLLSPLGILVGGAFAAGVAILGIFVAYLCGA